MVCRIYIKNGEEVLCLEDIRNLPSWVPGTLPYGQIFAAKRPGRIRVNILFRSVNVQDNIFLWENILILNVTPR